MNKVNKYTHLKWNKRKTTCTTCIQTYSYSFLVTTYFVLYYKKKVVKYLKKK